MTELRRYLPVIVIGAGRSGTNMLRNALAQLPGAGTWPCDEINYIWRHGNATHPDDEFDASMARPPVRRFVRRAFDRLARRRSLTHVIEKTCANSLRVGFVHQILPEARFVFLIRDGRDVTASAMERWRAPLDLPYLVRKARFVPLDDVPYYALRYLRNRFDRLLSKERRLSTWGPRFKGMDKAARGNDLPTLCARQWSLSVEKAEEELAQLPAEQVFHVRYEDFVRHPVSILGDVADFIEIEANYSDLTRAARQVTSTSVGKWRRRLTREQKEAIEPIVHSALIRHGYSVGT
ncbi:MAG: sulfotransferase family protein [bacterium]